MRELEISRNGCSVELFDTNGVPNDNEYITAKLKATENVPDAENLVRSYCRILGRLMLHSIAMPGRHSVYGYTEHCRMMLPSHILPDVYKYYYLKDIDPTNKSYPIENLVNDVRTSKLTADMTTLSDEQFIRLYVDSAEDVPYTNIRRRFREAAKKDLIENRSWAVEAIKEGLTLNGTPRCTTSKFFCSCFNHCFFLFVWSVCVL
jgi:hypothetical protein